MDLIRTRIFRHQIVSPTLTCRKEKGCKKAKNEMTETNEEEEEEKENREKK